MRRSRPVLCCSCCLCMCLCIWLFLCLCSCIFRVVWCGFGWWGSQDRWNNGDRPGIWEMHISVTVTMIVVTVKIVMVMTMMTWMVKLMTALMITRVKITLMITRTIEEAKTGGRMVAWWPGIRGGPHMCVCLQILLIRVAPNYQIPLNRDFEPHSINPFSSSLPPLRVMNFLLKSCCIMRLQWFQIDTF